MNMSISVKYENWEWNLFMQNSVVILRNGSDCFRQIIKSLLKTKKQSDSWNTERDNWAEFNQTSQDHFWLIHVQWTRHNSLLPQSSSFANLQSSQFDTTFTLVAISRKLKQRQPTSHVCDVSTKYLQHHKIEPTEMMQCCNPLRQPLDASLSLLTVASHPQVIFPPPPASQLPEQSTGATLRSASSADERQTGRQATRAQLWQG
jgi:hypothetical protein